jgi:hypothetical protein
MSIVLTELRALPLGIAGRTYWPLLTIFCLSLLDRVTFLLLHGVLTFEMETNFQIIQI